MTLALAEAQVRPMPSRLAREIVEREHYLHRKPPVSYAFGLFLSDEPVGVVTFGCPASHHMRAGACPSDPSRVLELNRLWVADSMPANSESWFVSRALRQMPPRIVLSYADTTQGHHGGVYRAMSFEYAGWTDMERRTPRMDYLPASGGHTRDAFRTGFTTKVRRRPKIKYWTVTGSRLERVGLRRLCAWPSLDWRLIPPPTEHLYHPLHHQEVAA
jgi:hypothetical protein